MKGSCRILAAFTLSALAGAVLVQSSPAGGPDSATGKLSKIAWMQGAWKSTADGDYLDEFWSPPHSDSMIGMFRWSKKDKLWMSEMLSIVTEGDTIVLRIKHFDRAMVGWEEKDKAITLPLVRQTADESVFETDDKADLVRLTYRKNGSNGLDVVLEHPGENASKQQRKEFRFTKMSL